MARDTEVSFRYLSSTEAPSKVFLLSFLFSDWPNSSHLKSRIECCCLDIFTCHICCAVTETIGVTNNVTSNGAKKMFKTKFEVAEVIRDPWNQQTRVTQCNLWVTTVLKLISCIYTKKLATSLKSSVVLKF